MIKFENTEVMGWEAAIRGMRNPMNSWKKSDSYEPNCMRNENMICEICEDETCMNSSSDGKYVIGANDLTLMKNLTKAGSDHGKYLRMITVYMDITAPLYWWKEFDTYKIGTVANSCSTMHKIHSKEFTLEDFSIEQLTEKVIDNIFKDILNSLNHFRNVYLEHKDKKDWWQMIQLLPSSYNQKRTIQLNYQVLKNMYHARKNHKLDEWKEFCFFIENLPYSELITEE